MAENEVNNTPPKKCKHIKYRYEQIFKAEYHDEFKFKKVGDRRHVCILLNTCCCDVNFEHGGRDDLRKPVATQKHLNH